MSNDHQPVVKLRWVLLGGAIGLFFLWLALRHADLEASMQALSNLSMQWLLPVLACALLFIATKTWRWQMLLGPMITGGDRTIGFDLLQRSIYAGTAANLVIAHAGEILRATLVARRSGQAPSAMLASIALERVLDFSALLIMIGVALLIDPRVSHLLWSAALISLILIALGLSVLLAMLNPGPRSNTLGQRLLRLLPQRIGDWTALQIGKGQAGLGTLRQPVTLLKVLALSVLQWTWIVLSIWASARAIGVPVPMSGAITVFVLTVIGLALPSSPAQLGTVQLAFVAGLTLVNAPAASAFAASLVYTGLVNGTMMLIGATYWLLWKHPLRTATAKATE